jgi:lipopolysaccharide biosynthesis regulator YciM
MNFDFSLLLLGAPVVFVLGWFASRLDMRQWRLENQQAPRAYFKGLNFLLNEQQDQAIDAFIEAVQKDPDTSELHFALGNLFRRRGEYERAVRVHEHLLARGDLSNTDRQRAQYALALDFLKAGILDRAESALLKLEGTAFEAQAQLALLANYERTRDWAQAARIAQKLESAQHGSFGARLAHYLCEQARDLPAAHSAQATHLLQQALETEPHGARAYLELARLQHQQQQTQEAYQTLVLAMGMCPAAQPLIAAPLTHAALACGQGTAALALLQASYERTPSLDVLDALVRLQEASHEAAPGARTRYVQHLAHEPSLVAAAKWLAGEKLEHEQFHPHVQRALDLAVKPLTRYRCAACGFTAEQHFWHCPGCQAWDSYPARRVEEL